MQEFVKVPWGDMILNKDLIEGIVIEPEEGCEEPRHRVRIWLKHNGIGQSICSFWLPKDKAYTYFYKLKDDLIFEE